MRTFRVEGVWDANVFTTKCEHNVTYSITRKQLCQDASFSNFNEIGEIILKHYKNHAFVRAWMMAVTIYPLRINDTLYRSLFLIKIRVLPRRYCTESCARATYGQNMRIFRRTVDKKHKHHANEVTEVP